MFVWLRACIFSYNFNDSWYCDWLHIPREDGKPRILFLDGCKQHGLIEHIKKVWEIILE
jgi:hypothetical protein